MTIDVLTLFPQMVEQALSWSIPARAAQAGVLTLRTHNLRDWGVDKHGNVDDTPYGGGPGMILRVDVAQSALEAVDPNHQGYRIMLTPDGDQFTQKLAKSFTQKEHLILLCGRYEGFDSRIEKYVDQKLSVGPYVLSGGELAAAIVADAVARLLPGALGNEESLKHETFEENQTDFPQFTRPDSYDGQEVPEVLKSGHHEQIRHWRENQKHAID